MNQSEVNTLVNLVGKCSYNAPNKAKFKRLSQKFLRAVCEQLGIDADIRYNAAGIASSGDAVLHGDRVYVNFNADGLCGLGVMYRTVKGRKDYTGGVNRWCSFQALRLGGVAGFVAAVKPLLSPKFDYDRRCECGAPWNNETGGFNCAA